jgi:hypothetical protein
MVVELKEKEEPLKEILRAKPMSKLSESFGTQNVGKVKLVLREFNSEVLPHFPIKEEQLAEGLSFFVDWKRKNTEFSLLSLREHGRSASFNFRFSDKYGNVYNYINLKGLGIPQLSYHSSFDETIANDTPSVWGMVDYEDAKADWEASNLFLRKGIRTSVPIAIGELKSTLLKSGEEASVKELKRSGVIPKGFIPVLYFRGFSEVMRLRDAKQEDYKSFAREHGISIEEYPSWWAGRQAENLARMHNLGKVHVYLHDGNLTLDGCIIDNESVIGKQEATGKDSFSSDMYEMMYATLSLETMHDSRKLHKATSLFLKGYLEEFTKAGEEYFRKMCDDYASLTNIQTKGELASMFKKRFGRKLEISPSDVTCQQ